MDSTVYIHPTPILFMSKSFSPLWARRLKSSPTTTAGLGTIGNVTDLNLT